MIRLIAVDIDGTLLDSRGRVPDAHRDALVEASRRGVEIALATGRSFHFTLPIASQLPIPLTLIVNNGALVKGGDGSTALRHMLPAGVARYVLEHTQAYEDSVAIVFDRPEERQVVFERMDWTHPNRRGYYDKNQAFIAATPSLAGALTEDPIQVMFNGSVEPMRALVNALKALAQADRFAVALTEYARRDFSLVDVTAAGCSKGSTLAKWADARGLTRDEVLAAGDNLNDVEMLEFAGTPVVMGNATAEVRSRVPHAIQVPSNDEGGLAEAVRGHVLM